MKNESDSGQNRCGVSALVVCYSQDICVILVCLYVWCLCMYGVWYDVVSSVLELLLEKNHPETC